ncbi:MAG: hypothetical protein V3S42_04505 [Candidatus Neomarinimicrobiota bacterium]
MIAFNGKEGIAMVAIPNGRDIEKTMKKDHPNVKEYCVFKEDDLPNDKEYCDAWEVDYKNNAIKINMDKAREIHVTRMVNLGKRRLGELGLPMNLESPLYKAMPEEVNLFVGYLKSLKKETYSKHSTLKSLRTDIIDISI